MRYAESNGYEADGERTDAWRYRDYVIQSLNEDKSYGQFLTEQLAGDELARGRDPRQCATLLIATGFSRCGPVHLVGGNTDPEVNRQELLTAGDDASQLKALKNLILTLPRSRDQETVLQQRWASGDAKGMSDLPLIPVA